MEKVEIEAKREAEQSNVENKEMRDMENDGEVMMEDAKEFDEDQEGEEQEGEGDEDMTEKDDTVLSQIATSVRTKLSGMTHESRASYVHSLKRRIDKEKEQRKQLEDKVKEIKKINQAIVKSVKSKQGFRSKN